MSLVREIQEFGQSVWLDQAALRLSDAPTRAWMQAELITGIISSEGLLSGDQVQRLLENPELRLLAHAGVEDEQVLRDLIVEHFRETVDILLPIFERTNGQDGFVTIEIDPRTFPDPDAMFTAAVQLWSHINRPNLLVGIPANKETMPLLRNLLIQGINVNATMISSLEQYLSVVEVYIRSLEDRLEAGKGIDHLVSVASFFLGDIDEQVNRLLNKFKGEGVEARRAGALVNEIGLAIAKLSYAQFNVSFEDDRFSRLAQAGGRKQRIVWTRLSSNTSMSYMDYLRRLISPGTIVAASLGQLEADRAELDLELTMDEGLSEARGKQQALASIGIFMEQVALDIERLHFEQRRQGYLTALSEVSSKTARYQLELGVLHEPYGRILKELISNDVIRRIWQADATLWSQDRREMKKIPAQMGWLELPVHISKVMQECRAFSEKLVNGNFSKLVVICPGSHGAFLRALGTQFRHSTRDLIVVEPTSPEKLANVGGVGANGMHFLFVIDQPGDELIENALSTTLNRLSERGVGDPGGYLTLVAQPKVLQAYQKLGRDSWGSLALPEDIPFHFSGLSYPGLLTASWLDLDLAAIRDGYTGMFNRCLPSVKAERNPAVALASVIEAGARSKLGMLELAADSSWFSYLHWVEGLMSECGLLGSTEVRLRGSGDEFSHDPNDGQSVSLFIRNSAEEGAQSDVAMSKQRPVKILSFPVSAGGVGGLFALFVFTCSVLGHLEAVNPFDARLEH